MTTNLATGQSSDTTVNKLLEGKIIEKRQVKDLKEFISRQDTISNINYLFALYHLETTKVVGKHNQGYVFISYSDIQFTEEEQLKINNQLKDYLLKLKDIRLVTEKQCEDHLFKISNNEYVDILQLLKDLYNNIHYEERISAKNISAFADRLLANNIITREAYLRLKDDASDGKISSHFQIIQYCEKARFFDVATYSDDPKEYLEQIHREVSLLLPELTFTDFSYEIVIDSSSLSSSYKSYNLIVSIKADGETYKQKSFISLKNSWEEANYLGKIDHQEFYKVFNKVLSDKQSPYRLHKVEFRKERNVANFQYFGIIALKKEQVEMFRISDSYFPMSYESFNNILTSKKIEEAISKYKTIELFKHLTKEQISLALEKVREQENLTLNDVLYCFPEVILGFDAEFSNLLQPYTNLIDSYAKISHGELRPTNISDNFDIEKKKKGVLKLKFNEKNYSFNFKINDDWIDVDFFQFIEKIVEENKLKGKFHYLYEGGQGVNVIYLTDYQYEYLKSNKLLVFSDDGLYDHK